MVGQQGGPRGRTKDMGPPRDWIDEGVERKKNQLKQLKQHENLLIAATSSQASKSFPFVFQPTADVVGFTKCRARRPMRLTWPSATEKARRRVANRTKRNKA